MKVKELSKIAGATLPVLLIASCKMPPKQAWQTIQAEGLVAYLAIEPKERSLGSGMQIFDADPQPLWSNFGWLDGGDSQTGEVAWGTDEGATLDVAGIRWGTPVPGQPGFVYSPHAAGKIVNVKRFHAGDEVRCPHSGRSFFVPSFGAQLIAESGDGERERLSFGAAELAEAPQEITQGQPETRAPEVAKQADGRTARWVPGRADLVYTPYGEAGQMVDVTGMKPGERARCPYSNQIFVIPPHGGAIAAAAGRKTEAQKAGEKELAAITEKLEYSVLEGVEKPGVVAAGDRKPATPGGGGDAIPTAVWADKPGQVKSPFGGHLVDVTGKASGSVVRCPFSGMLFKVPTPAE